MRTLIPSLILLLISFKHTCSEETTSSVTPSASSSPAPHFSKPRTPGANNVLSSKPKPCELVTAGHLDPTSSPTGSLTFITYCGKVKELGRVFPVYNYSLGSDKVKDSAKRDLQDSKDLQGSTDGTDSLLTGIPFAKLTGTSLVSVTWTSLEKVAKDTILTSAVIFSNGSDQAKPQADYILYVVTSDWRDIKFTSFVDLGHPGYHEMTPFLWDGAILISGCPKHCYYGLMGAGKSSKNNTSRSPMSLASYEFRYLTNDTDDAGFPPEVDLTDSNSIARTSPLLTICTVKDSAKTLLYLDSSKSSCSGAGTSAPDWSHVSTGMLFRGHFYLFSAEANRVYAFSEAAFSKPGSRVPLAVSSLKTFFGEVDDEVHSTAIPGSNSSSNSSGAAGGGGMATIYWIALVIVIILLIIALVVTVFHFASGSKKKKGKKQKSGKTKLSEVKKSSGGGGKSSSGSKKKGIALSRANNSSHDLKKKRTSRMTLAGKRKPSTVATSKAASSSVASSAARPSSAGAAALPPRASSASKLGLQSKAGGGGSQAAPQSVASKVGASAASKQQAQGSKSKVPMSSSFEGGGGGAKSNLKKVSQVAQHKGV